ncbi:MAG: SPOR domain-containing protein [Thalassobaculaceae bacterium]
MKRIIAVAALPALLGGCLPLPVTIATTAISGVSYLTTGKTSTDHVLSAAVDQDCTLTRPIFGETVCRAIDPNSPQAHERVVVAAHPGDRDDGDFRSTLDPELRLGAMRVDDLEEPPVLVAATLSSSISAAVPVRAPIETPGLETDGDETVRLTAEEVTAAATVAAPLPVARPATLQASIDGTVAQVSAPIDPLMSPAPASSPVAGQDGHYVVIGSLRDGARAAVLASRFGDLRPEIRRVSVDGQVWNRVVLGPYASDEARHVTADLGAIDGRQPWVVRLAEPVDQIAMR